MEKNTVEKEVSFVEKPESLNYLYKEYKISKKDDTLNKIYIILQKVAMTSINTHFTGNPFLKEEIKDQISSEFLQKILRGDDIKNLYSIFKRSCYYICLDYVFKYKNKIDDYSETSNDDNFEDNTQESRYRDSENKIDANKKIGKQVDKILKDLDFYLDEKSLKDRVIRNLLIRGEKLKLTNYLDSSGMKKYKFLNYWINSYFY